MIENAGGVWCGCVLDRIYVLLSAILAILGVIILGVVFGQLPKHEPLWVVGLIALIFHCLLVLVIVIFAYCSISINWDGEYKYELFADVEFGAGDGMHGVAEKGVYVIYVGNGVGSLGIFFISLSGLIIDSFSVPYVIGLVYGGILGVQGSISLYRLWKMV